MRYAPLVIALSLPLLLGPAPARPDDARPVEQQILGTWKLLSYVGEEMPSGARTNVMGEHPSGYINYGRDGRMMVIIVGEQRRKPAGALATPAEAQALLRSMLAYAGTYTLDTRAGTVTHHIDVSWDETRTGQSHVRTYKLQSGRLTLITAPSRDPATGRTSVRTVTWERVK